MLRNTTNVLAKLLTQNAYLGTPELRRAGGAVKQRGQWKLIKNKKFFQLCLFVFFSNVVFKNDKANYRKSYQIFCAPEKLQ